MISAHAMPFGAAVEGDATRFRLWAPGARSVALALSDRGMQRDIPLSRQPDGWCEIIVPRVGAGARYAYRIDDGRAVPDPASRSNPDGVHDASMVVDPNAHTWLDDDWKGRRWDDAVIYELHVGAFTASGTFTAAIDRLDYLADLGVTAVELMPVATFAGNRGWGYDGVLLYAPHPHYGTPEDLKRLVDAAHARGLMMLLDVVYNHFGPEGNYLRVYAPQFFNARHRTPWGDAINFDADASRTVRDFYIHNALYWLDEYHFDGLRMDAVHAIADDSQPDIVSELCAAVRTRFEGRRHVHIVLENDRNDARYLVRNGRLAPTLATAQWNDDIHHALHVLVTGERDGYYADYADKPLWQVGRCLAEGFAYQGDPSDFRGGEQRGDRSAHLPPAAFVDFMQTHDQIGNRAFGERIAALADAAALRAAIACVLLAPAPPMLFMGEEFASSSPFLYFCDFGPELAAAVANGRRDEFGRFDRFRDPAVRESIPDPNLESTFLASKLNWQEPAEEPGAQWLAYYRRCLALRHAHIVPRLRNMSSGGVFSIERDVLLRVHWLLGDGSRLNLLANFGDRAMRDVAIAAGTRVFDTDPDREPDETVVSLEPHSVVVTLEEKS